MYKCWRPINSYILGASAAVFFAFDRLFKHLALAGVSFGQGNPVEFHLFRNTGIAFSLPLPATLYWLATIPLFLLLVYLFIRQCKTDHLRAALLFLVIAGAASNILDHVLYAATIDYAIVFSRSAINLADAMIVGGLLALLLLNKDRSPATGS
jgi:lipoprotein signal peptidase